MDQDKIRILLLDDLPAFCRSLRTGRPELSDIDPSMSLERFLEEDLTSPWEEYFALDWIQTPMQARELLDGFHAIELRRPDALHTVGLPPEILIFDYALSEGLRPELEASEEDVLPRLRQLLDDLFIPEPSYQNEAFPGFERLRDETGHPEYSRDRMGCYIGVTLLRAFAAYPCGPLPTTAHVKDSDSAENQPGDAPPSAVFYSQFFEWLNETYCLDTFRDKSESKPTWEKLIPRAVVKLQERIKQLAQSGTVRVPYPVLVQLASEPSEMIGKTLPIRSRYGLRKLPIDGLFINAKFPQSEADRTGFEACASRWAQELLATKGGRKEYDEAYKIAIENYTRCLGNIGRWRRELCHLIWVRRTKAQDKRLTELAGFFGCTAQEVAFAGVESRKVKTNFLRSVNSRAKKNGDVARLAYLMLLVLQDMTLLDLIALDRNGNQLVDATEPIEDFAILADPSPNSILLETIRAPGKRPTEAVRQEMKSLGKFVTGSTKKPWGDKGLDRASVVDHQRPFDCPICQNAVPDAPPEGEHKSETRKYSHGLRPGEQSTLQEFADDIGFPENDWPDWLSVPPYARS